MKPVRLLLTAVAFPTKVIVDPEGRIAEIFVGERPGFTETMDRLLK